MLVSYKWLSEYVDIPVTPEKLAEEMTSAGVAVESLNYLGKGLDKIVTARVESVEKHPNADKLVVCQVNAGSETYQVVTGAPNVQAGRGVILALVGATLPGIKISKAKLRGIESSGMMCSAEELGLDPHDFPEDQREGILLFDPNIPLGVDVKEFLGLDDVILELDLTPNRADCTNMHGVAREVAAVLGTQFKMPVIEDCVAGSINDRVNIEISDSSLCGRYVARIIENVKIGPSPIWMQERLRAAGVRPISNIVDVTNYVMLEMGQPLHAFDYGKVDQHKIIVRSAKAGETLETLDHVNRTLDPDILVITDPKGPTAIAGVMGGLHSEITDDTTTVLLESAFFKPSSIHRTSKRLGLVSEASTRYAKEIDVNGCLLAANRACQLMKEIGAGVPVQGYIDNFPGPKENPVIMLRTQRVAKILGVHVPAEQIQKIMVGLGFVIKESNSEGVLVEVPTRRSDITTEIDLIEEVARLFGYNNIPITLPVGATTEGKKTIYQVMVDQIIDVLTAGGLNEIVTLSFMNPRVFDLLNLSADDERRKAIEVKNPLSEEQRILRTSMLPGILDILSRNTARKNKDLSFFEMGRLFTPVANAELPKETLSVVAAVSGKTPAGWQMKPVQMDFYYLKGIVENLLSEMNIYNYKFVPQTLDPAFHPGRTANIEIDGVVAGTIGEIHPNVAENYKLLDRTYVVQLNADLLMEKAGTFKKYSPLPKHPGMERDIALEVPTKVLAADLMKTIKDNGGKLLESVKLFDVYQGEQIKAGYKSMAFSLKFQANDRTLTDEEVNTVFEKIQNSLKNQYQAELRS